MIRTIIIDLEYRLALVLIAILLMVSGVDVILDLNAGIPLNHIYHELLTVFICLVIVIFQLRNLYKKGQELRKTQAELSELVHLREDFKSLSINYADQFSKVVMGQFEKWHLTQSEVDVATLLIKGFSMKEIAVLRNSQETTVRQQATSIYKKSGLGGRQQLAAFFLEDIF